MPMKVLIVEPGKYPREADIEHTLEAEQAVVGGTIEAVYPWRDSACIKKRRVETRLRISGSLVLPDIVFQITQTRFVVVNNRLRVFCIRKADNIAVFGFMKADKARITATAVTAG